MRKHYGFTIVELAVAISILVILLAIGIVSFRSTQIAARDREREADVKTLATYIESLYSSEVLSGSTKIKIAGSYPATQLVSNSGYYNLAFSDLPKYAAFAPGASSRSLTVSTNASGTFPVTATNISPAPTKDTYVYLPIGSNGSSLCTSITSECRSFQIYYRSEADNKIKFVESKRK